MRQHRVIRCTDIGKIRGMCLACAHDAIKLQAHRKLRNPWRMIPRNQGDLQQCIAVTRENCICSLPCWHIGNKGIPTLVVKTGCSWKFWHHDLGHSGALNYLNTLESNGLHDSLIGRMMPKIDFEFEINGVTFMY